MFTIHIDGSMPRPSINGHAYNSEMIVILVATYTVISRMSRLVAC